MVHNHISIKEIIAKIYRDLRLNYDIPEADMIEWAGEALLFIGAFRQFTSKTVSLDVDNFKTKLPCDFYKLEEITYQQVPMTWADNSMIDNFFCENCIPVKVGQDNERFYIKDGYLYVSTQAASANSNDLCMVYLSMPVDEEGFPTVPDDIYYKQAVTAYITKMLDYSEWRKGRIADKVYQNSEAKWDNYVMAARGAANMPDTAQLENLKNILQRLTPINNEYLSNWRNLRNQERKWRQ